jgi:hypothetical protein
MTFLAGFLALIFSVGQFRKFAGLFGMEVFLLFTQEALGMVILMHHPKRLAAPEEYLTISYPQLIPTPSLSSTPQPPPPLSLSFRRSFFVFCV